MTEPVKEHCRECGELLELYEIPGKKGGYIPEHHPPGASGSVASYLRCLGGGKRSREFADSKKTKKDRKHMAMLEHVREDVAIAFDAWEECRPGFKYDKLLELALTEYVRRYGKGSAGHLTPKPWITERVRGGRYDSYKVDVYCTFCRGLLRGMFLHGGNPETIPNVIKHTTGCALLCLAGRREMKPPGTRGLIDEDRAFAE